MAGRRRLDVRVVDGSRKPQTEYEMVLREARRELSQPGVAARLRSSAPKVRIPASVGTLRRRSA